MNVNSLSVFFPAFNEEKNIVNTVTKAVKVLEKLKFPWEIIIVDDGSSDNTKLLGQDLAKKQKKVRLVSQKNGGYGSALRRGFSEAKYDWVVYTDSDGQFDFSELPLLLHAANNAGAVWGYRKDRNDPWYRTVFGLLWKVPVRLLLGINLRDADCGFKLIRKSALDAILPLTSKRGAMINVELALKLKQQGLTIAQVGVSHFPRKFGQPSGYALPVVIRSYLDLLLMWLSSGRAKPVLGILVLLVILTTSLIMPFTFWPEFLNWPYFMSSGFLPYKDIAIVHTPLLLWLVQASYQAFGAEPEVLHTFGTLLIVLTTVCVYLVGRGNYLVGLLSAALFAFLVFSFGGNTVWFESALAPVLLLLFFFMRRGLEKPRGWISIICGLLWGVAIMTKQTTLYLSPVILFYLTYLTTNKKQTGIHFTLLFILLSLVPIIVIVGYLNYLGVLSDFYYWAIRFVFFKTSSGSGEFSYVLPPSLLQVLVAGALSIVALYIALYKRKPEAFLALGFFLFSLLFAYPRFEYFHLLPSLGFLAVLLSYPSYNKMKELSLPLVVIIIGIVVLWRTSLFNHTFVTIEAKILAERIVTAYPNDSVFVFNGPDEVYFLAKRLPAFRPWFAQLPWYYHYYGNARYFSDFVKREPDLIIARPFLTKSVGGLGAYKSQPIADYIESNYKEIDSVGDTLILKHQ